MTSRREYLTQIYPRYHGAGKSEKTSILAEFCENAGYNRKYAVRLLNGPLPEKTKYTRHRPLTYTNEHVYYLKKIWDILDNPCAERLKPMIPEMIEVLARCRELVVPETIARKLGQMGERTIDRRLEIFKSRLIRTIHSTTKPGSLLKKQIPMQLSRWNERVPGFTELDLVAHCGMSASGDFVSTLNLTDLATGWTESSALMGKAQIRVKQALQNIETRLPFELKGLDPDNGSEFINWQLYLYCLEKKIKFTRGRPGKKNDNAHIEEKNWTHVRKIVGYDRLDTADELEMLNSLYQGPLRLYLNFFQPGMRLKQKIRIGGTLKKQYDTAQTPYQRILKSRSIGREQKQELTRLYKTLNPVKLKIEIERHLRTLRRFVKEQRELTQRKEPARVTFSMTQRIRIVTFLDDWTRVMAIMHLIWCSALEIERTAMNFGIFQAIA